MRTNEQVTGIPDTQLNPKQLNDLIIEQSLLNYAPRLSDFEVIAASYVEPETVNNR